MEYKGYLLDQNDLEEQVKNIKDRLNSYYCSLCGGWLTKKENRPYTCRAVTENCNCPKGSHNSKISDVDSEDVEFLISYIYSLK